MSMAMRPVQPLVSEPFPGRLEVHGLLCEAGHQYEPLGPSLGERDTGWKCDGSPFGEGCSRGITEFKETTNVMRWRCATCDLDLCEACMAQYLQGLARAHVVPKCNEGHVLLPLEDVLDTGWACNRMYDSEGCRCGITGFNQSLGVDRWRCATCDFDLCVACSFFWEPPPAAPVPAVVPEPVPVPRPVPVPAPESEPESPSPKAPEPAPAAVPDGVTVVFETRGEEKAHNFTERPLGMRYYRHSPVRVASCARDSEAARLGVQRGWVIVGVGSASIRNLTFQQAQEILERETHSLPLRSSDRGLRSGPAS